MSRFTGSRRAVARLRAAARPGLLALLAAAGGAFAADSPPAPRPAPVVAYRIEARLDPQSRTVSGALRARWHNRGRSPVGELYLHLYLNAFAGNRTTLMSGQRRAAERWWSRHPDGWGRIDLATLRADGRDVAAGLAYVQPDDANPDDRSLARLTLPTPVPPRGSVELEIDFIAALPRLFVRSGHAAPFYFVAQWYPKLAVREDGRWRAHQYHAHSEFYADFASYDVELTVPAAYVLGHTGVAEAERSNGDGTKTVRVRAADVHDFAWTADPRFRVVEERVGDVIVRLLLQPHHLAQAPRYLAALHAAMQRTAAWFGPYPYPVLTLVDPGPGGWGGAGMEYPMLFTAGTAWWMPAGVRLPEMLTVHEFGHQYWQGMVANDEVNEAWLDEGINSYVEGLIMDETWGPGSYLDILGLRVGAVAAQRAQYLGGAGWDAIATPSFRMLDGSTYVATTYAQTALALRSLAGLAGGQAGMLAALADYFRTWQFGHPREADFRASLAAVLGPRADAWLEQLLHTTARLDYAVARVESEPVPPAAPSAGAAPPPAGEPTRYRSEVVVQRRGEVRVPVEILVAYDDGSTTRQTWDGESRWYRLDATGTRQVSYAVVDPDGRLPLDADRLNNSRLREPGTRGIWRLAGRWGLWLQGALMALSSV